MTKKLTRRRFLSVCAMAGTVSALPWVNALAAVPLHRWQGILLGAEVNLTLAHPSQKKADGIFKSCVREIKRLENIFTLYDSHSELSQLNANSLLQNPSPEMVDILNQARWYHKTTNGAFDVTVKPLEKSNTLNAVGIDGLYIDQKEIRFKKPGMSVTLNGIAQGYITDRITELLKGEGLKNVLVELGEKRTIGAHPSGRPWMIALPDLQKKIELKDAALATSSTLNGDNQKPHIFSPSSGEYITGNKTISVAAKTATMADALSTGFLSLSHDHIREILAKQPDIIEVYM